MISADEALQRLLDGNRRFVAGRLEGPDPARRVEVADGQEPFAIVLGCSDSRVPAEIVFDQGLGSLFVIRVAGNIVAPTLLGSVEFAASKFGTRLVMVLGHSRCGAVRTALEERAQPSEERSPNLAAIVDAILPTIEALPPGDDLEDRAVRANVQASVDAVRAGSAIIDDLMKHDGLQVVGAEYRLETGEVHLI